MFGSTSGLEEAHFRLLKQRATPQPYATFTSPLRLSGKRPGRVRRVAIFCSRGGISLTVLRDLIADGDARAAIFADPDWELHELPTGHWAMLSAPRPLVELLHRIAAPSDPGQPPS
jgi:hypothetical protein